MCLENEGSCLKGRTYHQLEHCQSVLLYKNGHKGIIATVLRTSMRPDDTGTNIDTPRLHNRETKRTENGLL